MAGPARISTLLFVGEFPQAETCSSVKGRLTHTCVLDLWNGSSLRASASGLVPALAISSGFSLPSEMRTQPHMPPSWSLRLKEKAQMASELEWEWPLGRTNSRLWAWILRRHWQVAAWMPGAQPGGAQHRLGRWGNAAGFLCPLKLSEKYRDRVWR